MIVDGGEFELEVSEKDEEDGFHSGFEGERSKISDGDATRKKGWESDDELCESESIALAESRVKEKRW